MSISMGTSLRTNIHLQRSWSRSTAELLLSPVAFQDVSRLAGSLPKTLSMHQGLNGDHTNHLAPGIFDRLTLCIQRLLRTAPPSWTFNSATPHCSMMIPRLAKGLEGHLDDLLGKFQFYFGSTHVAHVCKIKAVPYQKIPKKILYYKL